MWTEGRVSGRSIGCIRNALERTEVDGLKKGVVLRWETRDAFCQSVDNQ